VTSARIATPADIPAVAETLAGAFFADPLWGWAFADASLRHSQQLALWTLALEGGIGYEWVWTLPAAAAVALWIPPGCAELSPPHAARLEPLMREVVPERAELILDVFDRFDAARPSSPHFYLSLLGTDPAHLGHGYGIALLRENLALIDAAGMPAYLESSNPANLGRYESVGFRAHGEITIPDGPLITTMWRG
jgi:GNAT superfamily N-acetyltransferase